MKYCVSTDVGTWTNWLTFEPDPHYSPDAGTGLLSPLSYKLSYAEFYVWKIPRIRIGAARRCSDAWFYSFTCRNNFVGGTCAPSSVLLVWQALFPNWWNMQSVVGLASWTTPICIISYTRYNMVLVLFVLDKNQLIDLVNDIANNMQSGLQTDVCVL